MGAMHYSWDIAADLSSYQYHCVKLSDDDSINVAGANERAIGILQDIPDTVGEAADVIISGPSRAVAGEIITVGQQLTCKSDGHVEVADAAGEWCIGYALTAAGAAGDIIWIMVNPHEAYDSDA